MNICVIFATRHRPVVLSQVVATLHRQSLPPAAILLSCVTPDDAGEAARAPGVTLLLGPPGLTAQRNTALDRLPEATDLVVFFDDDFLPHSGWLAAAAAAFGAEPGLAAVTGDLIEDEARGTEVDFARARALLEGWSPPSAPAILRDVSPYGCNMAYRAAAIEGLRFDTRLAAYGWLEDFDFGAQVVRRGGATARIGTAAGVHMQVRAGRIPGRGFGYAQVVNPLYLGRKGTMPLGEAVRRVWGDLSGNAARALSPPGTVDYRGRLRGNVSGLLAVARGRAAPERVTDF